MSEYRHIRAAIAAEPWAIMPDKLEAILALVALRANGGERSPDEIHAAIGAARSSGARAGTGAVQVLPLWGVVCPRANMMTEFSGGVSAEQFGKQLDAAMRDPAISAVILDVDSPGGSVQGVAELAAKIKSYRGVKPIIASVNPLMASAAYWIGTAADEVCMTPSGLVGSVGVIAVHEDTSGADAEAGVKYTTISAGKYKGEGGPHEPLTDDARAEMQRMIDSYYSDFTRALASQRGVSVETVRSTFGEGRVMTAKQALAVGMIDRIESFESTLARVVGGKFSASTSARAISTSTTGGVAALIEMHDLTDVGGTTAAQLTSLPVAALRPKEYAMSDTLTAATDELATMRADIARRDAIAALATEHGMADKTHAWQTSGKSVAAVQSEIIGSLKDKLSAGPVLAAPAAPIVAVGMDREAARPFATLGEQLMAIKAAGTPGGSVDKRLLGVNAAISGLGESVSQDGGFAVQPDFLSEIMEPAFEKGEVLKRVRRVPVSASSNGLSFLVVDETSRTTGSRWGGVQSRWVAEGDQGTGTKPKLRLMKLDLKKLLSLAFMTDELVQDAAALQTLLTSALQDETTFMTEDAFINGDGVGKPLGILNSGAVATQAIESTQTIANTGQFISFNVSKMLARVPLHRRDGLVFYYNQELLPYFVNATVGTATTVPVWLPPTGLAGNLYGTILGIPAVPIEYCSAVGTPGDIILADMSQYITIDKGGVQAATSMHLRFDYDEMAFRIVYRVDGQPLWRQPVTPFKGAATRSPFVTLNTRS